MTIDPAAPHPARPRTLVVTNDFPPRAGGIETLVHELLRRQHPDSIAVLAPSAAARTDGATSHEARDYDAAAGYPVARVRAGVWPLPRLADTAVRMAREFGCDRVWLPSSAPHGLLVPMLQRRGLPVAVATTHGAEAGMAGYPGGRAILRAAGQAQVLTHLGAWTRSQVARALVGQRPESGWARLAPGVDLDAWRRTPAVLERAAALRKELGIHDRPVVACVSRLVRRKGQDRLIAAMSTVVRTHPDTVLLIVGAGPLASKLRAQAAPLGSSVVFTGRVPYDELPAYTAVADIAGLPARSRLGGLDVEGLGIVLLEAAAMGLPTIAADTGGVPDALVPGTTGLLLPALTDERAQVAALAEAIVTLLDDAGLRSRLGEQGRRWVEQHWSWDVPARTLANLLARDPGV